MPKGEVFTSYVVYSIKKGHELSSAFSSDSYEARGETRGGEDAIVLGHFQNSCAKIQSNANLLYWIIGFVYRYSGNGNFYVENQYNEFALRFPFGCFEAHGMPKPLGCIGIAMRLGRLGLIN